MRNGDTRSIPTEVLSMKALKNATIFAVRKPPEARHPGIGLHGLFNAVRFAHQEVVGMGQGVQLLLGAVVVDAGLHL